jgi:hypothetical protein
MVIALISFQTDADLIFKNNIHLNLYKLNYFKHNLLFNPRYLRFFLVMPGVRELKIAI